jgi:hypothetical protein
VAMGRNSPRMKWRDLVLGSNLSRCDAPPDRKRKTTDRAGGPSRLRRSEVTSYAA